MNAMESEVVGLERQHSTLQSMLQTFGLVLPLRISGQINFFSRRKARVWLSKDKRIMLPPFFLL
jgi:hypothetical protein